ncbi:MAG: TRAP transporter substrate-binding protein DctP [Desulfobacter sp.]|nr:MAG: TRAP transporter substrate-binding protein DctP [Desulfobacter sp.]
MKPFYFFMGLFGLVFVAAFPAPGHSAGESDRQTWKLASLAPKHVGWAKHIREIIHPAVSRATGGNLTPRWYWGGIMGEDRDYIDKMKIGQLDGAAFTGQGVVMVLPEMSVLELPFMFNSYDEVDYVRKRMFPTFDALARKRGYIITAWADQDFDQIYSSKYPMARVEDFKKAKFLTWYGPVEHKVLARLDVRPIPMGVLEISPALRQNMADTIIAPAVWILGSQLYTTIKYVNPVKIRYSPVALFINIEAWNRLPQTYQDKLLAIRDNELKEFTQKSRMDSKRALDAMVTKAGVKKISMEKEELDKFRRLVKPVWYEMAGKDFPRSLLDELLAHLDDYRSTRAD